jgi:FAD/FMN-containing dehydrogenase
VADDLPAALAGIVGPAHVLVDPGVRAGFEVDWTGQHGGVSRAVVRPGSTAEVAAVLVACGEAGAAVVPQGGNTGLVGGGVPAGGEVVLSLRRLAAIGPVDPLAGQVTAGAGVVLADLQRTLAPVGLELGVDLAARDGATIGGLVATNAGGLRVLRHGTMRSQVVGVEAVLADGRVLSRLAGLAKDATGYDLGGLLVGSEGTLAVVTAARLRLVRRRPHRVAALLALASVADAVAVAVSLRDELDDLDTAELVIGRTLDLVDRERGIGPAFSPTPPAALLVECGGRHEAPLEALAGAVGACGGAVLDAAVSSDEVTRARLWRHREEITEALQGVGPPRKLDVSLPLPRLAAFTTEVAQRVATVAPGAACHVFGHVLDGNLHVNVTGVPAAGAGAVDEAVLGLVAEVGGSIGAEHGIGRAKVGWLHLSRSRAELDAFRSLKAALDPAGMLNPGVLLPAAAPPGTGAGGAGAVSGRGRAVDTGTGARPRSAGAGAGGHAGADDDGEARPTA